MMKYKRLTDKEWHIAKFGYTSTEHTRKILKRLWDLENKIENGTLIELPCKVGDTVYAVVRKGDISSGEYILKPFIEKGKVRDIAVGSCGFNMNVCFENIGYLALHEESNVFLTCEEAERRLKELQNG